MKKCIALLILPLSIIACRNDNDNGLTRTGTIEQRVGHEWELTSVEYEAYLPNPVNPSQGANISGSGEDVYGAFDFRTDNSADYFMGFTARIDIGTSEPLRLPFYRSGEGSWWMVGNDSIYLEDGIDTLKYEIIEDWDQKQRWQSVVPILDSATNTFVPVDMEVILRR